MSPQYYHDYAHVSETKLKIAYKEIRDAKISLDDDDEMLIGLTTNYTRNFLIEGK